MHYKKIFRISAKAILESIVAFLVFIFLYTGLSKYLNFAQFKATLGESPMLAGYKNFVALFLPGIEIATVIILIWPKTRLLGLYVSLTLLSMFTLYLIYMVNFDPKLPCSCGGIIGQLNWRQHIVFNLILLLSNIVAIRIGRGFASNGSTVVAG